MYLHSAEAVKMYSTFETQSCNKLLTCCKGPVLWLPEAALHQLSPSTSSHFLFRCCAVFSPQPIHNLNAHKPDAQSDDTTQTSPHPQRLIPPHASHHPLPLHAAFSCRAGLDPWFYK